jgi:hypothetical protein
MGKGYIDNSRYFYTLPLINGRSKSEVIDIFTNLTNNVVGSDLKIANQLVSVDWDDTTFSKFKDQIEDLISELENCQTKIDTLDASMNSINASMNYSS